MICFCDQNFFFFFLHNSLEYLAIPLPQSYLSRHSALITSFTTHPSPLTALPPPFSPHTTTRPQSPSTTPPAAMPRSIQPLTPLADMLAPTLHTALAPKVTRSSSISSIASSSCSTSSTYSRSADDMLDRLAALAVSGRALVSLGFGSAWGIDSSFGHVFPSSHLCSGLCCYTSPFRYSTLPVLSPCTVLFCSQRPLSYSPACPASLPHLSSLLRIT